MDIVNGTHVGMREPCKACGHNNGIVKLSGGQDVVRCAECGKYAYCQPKSESGRKRRTTSTTHQAISPKQRSRVIARANHRCERCGTQPNSGIGLHVGHVVSVLDGHRFGLTDHQINSDENLIAECPECNLGHGSEPLQLRNYIAILMARTEVQR